MGFPEGEIRDAVAFVLIGEVTVSGAVGLLGLEGLGIEVGELAVVGEVVDAVVDGAVGCLIGELAFDELPDQFNLLGNVFGGAWLVVGREQIEFLAILMEAPGPEVSKFVKGLPCFLRALDGFVVHIGDIADIERVIAGQLEEAVEAVEAEESDEVAYVGGAVDGGTADIHAEAP